MTRHERLQILARALSALADQPVAADICDGLRTLHSDLECEPTIAEELRGVLGRIRRLEGQVDTVAARCKLLACALPGDQAAYGAAIITPLDNLAADTQSVVADLECATEIAEGEAGAEILAAAVHSPDPVKVRADLADARDKMISAGEILRQTGTEAEAVEAHLNGDRFYTREAAAARFAGVMEKRKAAAKDISTAMVTLTALVPESDVRPGGVEAPPH